MSTDASTAVTPEGGPTPAAAEKFAEIIQKARHEIHKVIIGQEDMVELTLMAIFCHQHALLMGVPGLAKTLLVNTVSQVLGVKAARIQFTPDLMPSDITGTDIIQEDPDTGRREFQFVPGPIFANIVLADEINRTPPKTQAALLEAMQERQVTVGTTKYPLEKPFFVLATQNPIEQEGTYNLPEAQLDRMMFLIYVDYPEMLDEIEMLKRTTGAKVDTPDTVLDGQTILEYQHIIRQVIVREDLYDYALRLVHATRVTKDYCLPYCKQWVAWGAGPRAGQMLLLSSKARAFFNGRPHITTEDIRAVAHPVLRHRVLVNYAGMAEGIKSDDVVDELLKNVAPPSER